MVDLQELHKAILSVPLVVEHQAAADISRLMNSAADEIVELRAKANDFEVALDALVHANEDRIDDYETIDEACDAAIALLPDYEPIEDEI